MGPTTNAQTVRITYFNQGDRLTWDGRKGTVLTVIDNHHNGHGYVRLFMDDVALAYWVEFSRLAYA